MTPDQCAAKIVEASTPVLKIDGFTGDLWYRKPKDGRKGPWLQGRVEFLNEKRWNTRTPCLYFLLNSSSQMKYVGISVNQLKDRWRMSPAYDLNEVSLNRGEMFHSQCWPHMCNLENQGIKETYSIVVIDGPELLAVLTDLDHEISALSIMKNDPEIAIIAIEVWFIKRFKNILWNKRK